MMSRIGRWALSLLIFSSFALVDQTRAQVGTIRGEVKDAQGKPLKDVEIRIEGLNVGRKYKVKSDGEGKFLHAGVSLQGQYRVIAEKQGFQSDYVEGVVPGFGTSDKERGIVNFVLKSGQTGKLAFELTDEDRAKLEKEQAEQKKRQESASKLQEHFNSGMMFYRQEHYQQAIESFEKALAIDSEQTAVWANMANTYAKMEQFDKSIETYERAIAMAPEDPALHQNLGSVYAQLGQTDKAQEYYAKAAGLSAAIDPASAAGSYYNMAVTYINSGKTEQAIETLKKALEADPNHAEAHYQLGLTLVGTNQMEEAVTHLKKYLELAPNGPNASVARALLEQLDQG